MFYSLNNKIYQENENQISVNNRSFRYGDGFFETIKIIDNIIQLKEYHFERIAKSFDILKFETPKHFSFKQFEEQILALAQKNNHSKTARIRVNFFRNDEGLFEVKSHQPNILIQSFALENSGKLLNENGLVIDVYPDAKKSTDTFSNIKSNNYLQYAMAAIWAKENKLNDALLLNTNHTIADSCIANIFIVKAETVYTPTLQDGCVNGVMRRNIIEKLQQCNISVVEKSLTIEDVETANEIFLTNVIKGISWVKQFKNSNYSNSFIQSIVAKMK